MMLQRLHWVTESTRYKLNDILTAVLRGDADKANHAPNPRKNGITSERFERLIGKARHRATVQCGVYLSHARLDLTYEDIEKILTDAGGDAVAIANLRPLLVQWREGRASSATA